MSISMSDIKWGTYKDFEGPWTLGRWKYVLPKEPSDSEKIMAVITATEGGGYDVVNMYDSCLWTLGIIQWCNRPPQHSVDNMMGVLFAQDPKLIAPVTDLAEERGYKFRSVGGSPRFIDKDYHTVSTVELQQKLFFGTSTGQKGRWRSDADREWAKRWCLASALIWDNPVARSLQVKYTTPKLESFFAYGAGKEVLKQMPDTPVGHAWRAMYLSFAANNPAKTAAAVENALRDSAGLMEPWTEVWLANMAQHMIFDPGISIYPHRYSKIRPVIEKMWGVDLPDTAEQAKQWASEAQIGHRWLDPFELQRALIAIGMDLGPKGADGVIGGKTRAQLLNFEQGAGIPKEHQDGMPDQYTLAALERALEARGITELT